MRQWMRWQRPWTQLDWAIARLMETGEPLSAAEMAEIVGCTPTAVKNIRKRLVSDGFFKVVDPGGGRGRPARYQVID